MAVFNHVTMHFVKVAGDDQTQQSAVKCKMAYQLNENDEKSSEDQGHSVMTRGRELVHMMERVRATGKSGSAQDHAQARVSI